ncbi:hypothetical protein PINS_up022659 [Pythium insidiosum]|nr:hypothetical protein PINS_up022659 [Pythium insidiosum]
MDDAVVAVEATTEKPSHVSGALVDNGRHVDVVQAESNHADVNAAATDAELTAGTPHHSSTSSSSHEPATDVFDPTEIIRNYVPEASSESKQQQEQAPAGFVAPQPSTLAPEDGSETSPPAPEPSQQHTPNDAPPSPQDALKTVEPSPAPRSSPGPQDIPLAPSADVQPPVPDAAPPPPSESFLTSLTSRFNQQTQSTWSLFFGSRYEDDPLDTTTPEQQQQQQQQQNDPAVAASNTSHANSLRAKLERERKLDAQIQASRQKYRERAMRQQSTATTERATSTTSRRRRRASSSSSVSTMALHSAPPLEKAGYSTTVVRVAMETAQQATCAVFRELHAIAQCEPVEPTADLGIFLTQWELDSILHELFGPSAPLDQHDATPSLTLALQHRDYAAFPLETLLQISWFLPFDDFPRLRSCVAHVARKHLSERRLAVLNMALRRQLLLLPHSVSLQRSLVEIVRVLRIDRREMIDHERERERNRDDERQAVSNLLSALRVPVARQHERDTTENVPCVHEFLRLSPVRWVVDSHGELVSVATDGGD